MANGWRLARSLEVLEAEIRQVAPGTTVWDIGDESHQDDWSDHNPNDEDVVCAIDALPDGGLDLGQFAEEVRASRHPALKYVIFNRRIASRSRDWAWRPYHGSNPHTGHAHVSVGRGPDGRSTGPYDDTSPWGVAPRDEGGLIMLPRQGDESEDVETVQWMLNALDYDIGEDSSGDPLTDGIYGEKTEAAVAAFRRNNSRSADGVGRVTPWTYYRLVRKVGALDGGRGDVQLPDSVQVSGQLDVES